MGAGRATKEQPTYVRVKETGMTSEEELVVRTEVLAEVNRKLHILVDIKKEVWYCKSEGKWYWCGRHGVKLPEESYGPFNTFMGAVEDAVEPYIGEGSDKEE